ncbi:TetR/AcrR family transcriptional regulator [candidate division KSB1 bacterium]|nr:TetR/AcrR family transcriptional regulator [candidate division KSB1 bacterium]
MKTTRKFIHIQKAATSLFKRYGFDRVTIEEICREANVSKMTFYKYFSNKKSLIKYIIADLIDQSMREYDAIMNSERTYDQKVRLLIEKKMRDTDSVGQDFVREYLFNKDPELRMFIEEQIQRLMMKVNQFFIEAQRDGHIRSNIKPEFLPYILNHLITMAEDETLNSMYNSPQQLVSELINFCFYGILEKEKE